MACHDNRRSGKTDHLAARVAKCNRYTDQNFQIEFYPKKARKLRQIIGGSKSRMPPGLTTWHLPREVLDSDTGVTTPEPAHLNI